MGAGKPMGKTGNVVWKFGDNYNADLIVGSKYIGERDADILAKVCLAEYDPDLVSRIQPGDMMVAGANFGYGHPHYQGIMSLIKNGISTLIAESFYPLWYRLAFFYAFPVLVCPDISRKAEVGHRLEVDLAKGEIINLTTGDVVSAEPVPEFLMEIVEAGGLISHVKRKIA